MKALRTQRLRDPIHGLIVFKDDNKIDQLAWNLIDTPEFQRLRRIKQLGLSELVFPGATHTRFAHSIGVYHLARELVEIVKRELSKQSDEEYNPERAEVALIAALLHDLGHGPLSHAFEHVLKAIGEGKNHEIWTAEIILNRDGNIFRILEQHRKGFAQDIADLLASESPADIYHAIVSSSFDADRLDYLQRDRAMTGTGAGAIDFEWLKEHVRVKKVNLDIDSAELGDDGICAPTFCIDIKALPAAEQFLISRYTMHEQVYLHKTTKCAEFMVTEILKKVSTLCSNKNQAPKKTGLSKNNPFLKFFTGGDLSLDDYLLLDDISLMSSIEAMRNANDKDLKNLATRFIKRDLFKPLDIREFGSDSGKQRMRARKIDEKFKGNTDFFKDESASLNIYSQIGGDDELAHKKLRIIETNGNTPEITNPNISKFITEKLTNKKLTRYYFSNESDREIARAL